MPEGGYVCVPYLQNNDFIALRNAFQKSEYIDDMYFATATFSEDGRAYFPSQIQHISSCQIQRSISNNE